MRRSSSSTYVAVSASAATASLTWRWYASAASSSSSVSTSHCSSSARRSTSDLAAHAPHRVVQDADDPRGALVARGLEAELLDRLRIGRATGDRRRARVRHVCQERAERDDELDAEIGCHPRHVLRE